jgi:hypothetical protein
VGTVKANLFHALANLRKRLVAAPRPLEAVASVVAADQEGR